VHVDKRKYRQAGLLCLNREKSRKKARQTGWGKHGRGEGEIRESDKRNRRRVRE